MGAVSVLCPKCGAVNERHCDSGQCDLIRCRKCKSFGTRDGRLWQPDPRYQREKP